MGVNSLPKTVTRQRRDCDLNPGPSARESSTLTTRLPSHPFILLYFYRCGVNMQKKLEVDGKPVRVCVCRGTRAHARTDRRTNRKHNASDTHGMGGGVAHVARPAPKRFHPLSDWRALEACCRPWTWWCNDATALAGYATMTTTMTRLSKCRQEFG